MPEDVFRWVVAVGVVLASLAFIWQSIVVAAIYKAGREAQKAGKEAQGKIGPIIDHVEAILATTLKIIEDNRPRIAEVSAEASVIIKTTRHQVERISELLDDAGERAKTRIAQIDQTVDQTVGQVEHVSEAVKSAVLKPVKEVNGVLAGMKAAVATLAQGGRRPSVEHATQDEEMFI